MSVKSKTDSSSKIDVAEDIKKYLGQDVDMGLLRVSELSFSTDVSFETHVLVIPSELSPEVRSKGCRLFEHTQGCYSRSC